MCTAVYCHICTGAFGGSVGFVDHTPVFVVGLPRSGSTLLETMFGSHTDVWPAGEDTVLAPLTSGCWAGRGWAGRGEAGRGGAGLGRLGRGIQPGVIDLAAHTAWCWHALPPRHIERLHLMPVTTTTTRYCTGSACTATHTSSTSADTCAASVHALIWVLVREHF